MNKNILLQKIHTTLEDKGYKVKAVSANHILELRNDIKKHHDKNLFYPVFYEEYKEYFEFEPDVDFTQINSLIIIAVPVPQFKVTFHWKNEDVSLLVPPTYLHSLKLIDELTELLNDILNPEGYNIAYAKLPQKTLAVRSGLAEYGRTNITYVHGMGSFHRLTTFYSDFPVEDENWNELRMMDLCKECSACVRKCPTGAIPTDRFLLRVERCLTYHNEQEIDVPFPDWIDPTWHNCLVGCLHCQKVCPANKKVINWTELGPKFSEEESQLILSGKKIDQLPDEMKRKVEEHDLANYFEIFPRNLGVFLK